MFKSFSYRTAVYQRFASLGVDPRNRLWTYVRRPAADMGFEKGWTPEEAALAVLFLPDVLPFGSDLPEVAAARNEWKFSVRAGVEKWIEEGKVSADFPDKLGAATNDRVSELVRLHYFTDDSHPLLPNQTTRDSPTYLYHDNGQLQEKGAYRNRKQEGPWVSYHDTGQLKAKGAFKGGEWEGPWVWYHDNGQLAGKGAFKGGEWEGPAVGYDEDGNKEHWSGTYRNGEKVSD